MIFVIVLLITLVAVIALKRPIRRFPVLFYALAIAFDLLFVASSFIEFPRLLDDALFLLMQKCTLAFVLFVIVMYIGVLPQRSRARAYLASVRAELSIIAWILSLGHMVRYLASYIPQISHGFGHIGEFVLSSLAVALLLFVLLAVLGVTSFRFVKKHMSPHLWKRVQQFAYLFFLLVYVHLLLMLMPAAAAGSARALEGVVVYTVIIGTYAILRVSRALKDRKTSSNL